MESSAPGVNILAIDGGALKGVIPARILSYLDGSASADTKYPALANIPSLQGNTPLNKWFNVIGGSSTGGLLAACLSVPTSDGGTNTADQALSLYAANPSSIFPTSLEAARAGDGQLFFSENTMYGNAGLAIAIANLYGLPNWALALTRTPVAVGMPVT